jgi:hypothetical protein
MAKQMLTSKHFRTEQELLDFANMETIFPFIFTIFKDVTNGDWILFYAL